MRCAMRRAMLPAALSVLLLVAGPAVSARACESGDTARQEPTGPHGEDVAHFRQANVTLSGAIAAAKNHGAGQLVEVRFDVSSGHAGLQGEDVSERRDVG